MVKDCFQEEVTVRYLRGYLCLLISCKKILEFGIRIPMHIVAQGDRQDVAGVHLGWFLPPFIKGGGGGDFWYKPAAEIPPSPPFPKGGFAAILRFLLTRSFLKFVFNCCSE
jgi:hypothetical protein